MNVTPSSRIRIFNILVIAVCAAVFSSPASAQSSLTDDAHTNTSPRSGDSNFGNNPNLSLSSSGNVYIKFNLGSTLPAATPGSQVEKATLKLFISNVASPGKLDVYELIGEWQESTITANTAPILGSLVATTQLITTDQKGKFLVIDITATVQQWLGSDGQGAGGIPNHGIALLAHPVDGTTPELATITFDSKENSQTSHEARLHIYLEGEAPGGGLESVAHDATLTGDGTAGSPLGVASGGITTTQLANGAVTGSKIALGAVNSATILDGAVLGADLADGAVSGTKLADGSVTSAKVASPLSLASADPGFTLSVTNTGDGAAITATGTINTTAQYNIGGRRMFSSSGPFNNGVTILSGSNTIAGENAGLNTTPDPANLSSAGKFNSLFGADAGKATTIGNSNSFFGALAGEKNTTGNSNSFFGERSGSANTEGTGNSFFGRHSGRNNTTGTFNAFFGSDAGFSNTEGNFNAFYGPSVGILNTTGAVNSFFGRAAGNTNVTGGRNTIIGGIADVGAGNLVNATAIGANARVDQSNSLVLGSINGINGGIATVNVGIGTTAPADRLHVNGIVRIDALGAAGATQLCRNPSNQISDCSSSLRYKDQIAPFTAGLDLIEKLRPISYAWRAGGDRDLGFGAEEVAQIDPLLVTRNAKGDVEGVKYDRIAVVLVNAVKEQQQLIKAQQILLESQQRQIERLKEIICVDRPDAPLCK